MCRRRRTPDGGRMVESSFAVLFGAREIDRALAAHVAAVAKADARAAVEMARHHDTAEPRPMVEERDFFAHVRDPSRVLGAPRAAAALEFTVEELTRRRV